MPHGHAWLTTTDIRIRVCFLFVNIMYLLINFAYGEFSLIIDLLNGAGGCSLTGMMLYPVCLISRLIDLVHYYDPALAGFDSYLKSQITCNGSRNAQK